MNLFSGIFSRKRVTAPAVAPMSVSRKPKLPTTLHVTLWPTFGHFHRFSIDSRVQGIRMNSAMISAPEINDDFFIKTKDASVPLWFDVKGMQMRVKEVACDPAKDDHLELVMNRPIRCKLPCPVWFKAGEDCAKLIEIRNGTHLIFDGGPRNLVSPGESIHIREEDLQVGGPPLLAYEIEKIERIKKFGFKKFYLSYVYDQRHVDAFREAVGPDAEIILKIENKAGLEYVARQYKPTPKTRLAAARGDLFVEVDYPHHILEATKLIIDKDPNAIVGSRMLLSVIHKEVPDCADLNELAWLYDIGYRSFLLCDELCLKGDLLGRAVAVFNAFRKDYCKEK